MLKKNGIWKLYLSSLKQAFTTGLQRVICPIKLRGKKNHSWSIKITANITKLMMLYTLENSNSASLHNVCLFLGNGKTQNCFCCGIAEWNIELPWHQTCRRKNKKMVSTVQNKLCKKQKKRKRKEKGVYGGG